MENVTSVFLRYTVFLWVITSLYTTDAIENGGVINIDLSSLNTSTHEAIKIREIIDGSVQIHLDNVSMIGYFIIQVHSFETPVYLVRSNVSEEQPGINGTNIGLVEIWMSNEYDYIIETNGFSNVSVLIVVIGYDIKAPVPGGCNLTFETEDAPYQKIVFSEAMIEVMAQAPRLYNLPCSSERIDIDVYHFYLNEQDYSSEEYFRGIEKMLTPESIQRYGRKVEKPHNLPDIKRYFSLYAGVGTVYAIVTNFRGFTSAYVPAVSYGCDFTDHIDDCSGAVSTSWKVLTGLLCSYGIFLCMTGHRFFQINLFCMGFIVAAVVTFAVTSYTNLSEGEVWITLAIVGVLYGSFWVIIWWKFKLPLLSIMLNYFVAGFLVAGIFFYVGPADTNMFRNNINYWSLLIGISLLVHLVLLVISHWPSNIIATSFIGAYLFIIPYDLSSFSTIRYIFLNILRRATVPDFNLAIIDAPRQANELALVISWCFLTFLGIAYQYRQNKGRAPFPPPPTIRIEDENTPNENSPLLANIHNQ